MAPARRRRDAAMDGYPASGPNRLAQSYADQAGLFSTAFVYDNALAILAYLADDRSGSRSRAVVLGDALLFAQNHDPNHTDGRLRQAYNVGGRRADGFVGPDGKANVGAQLGFRGPMGGDRAGVGRASPALYRHTHA